MHRRRFGMHAAQVTDSDGMKTWFTSVVVQELGNREIVTLQCYPRVKENVETDLGTQ